MSTPRSGKAIKNEVFENPTNPLIIFDSFPIYFTKLEDKLTALDTCKLDGEATVCFVWTGKTRSDVFKLDQEDIQRLLDNKNKDV